jgi:hypothetical protein
VSDREQSSRAVLFQVRGPADRPVTPMHPLREVESDGQSLLHLLRQSLALRDAKGPHGWIDE